MDSLNRLLPLCPDSVRPRLFCSFSESPMASAMRPSRLRPSVRSLPWNCSRPAISPPPSMEGVSSTFWPPGCWKYRAILPLPGNSRSEEHTSELQSPCNLVCRLLLEKKHPAYLFPRLLPFPPSFFLPSLALPSLPLPHPLADHRAFAHPFALAIHATCDIRNTSRSPL